MRQNPSESVFNFVHRFLETQNSLEKLIPGIHSSPNGNQMELVHAFSMKLNADISKFLLSRDEPFSDIMQAIECANRHKSVSEKEKEAAAAIYVHPAKSNEVEKPKGMQMKTDICRNFNKFFPSRCELPQNQCKNGYVQMQRV